MNRTALIIGNSDGIGLALTRKLLNREWLVNGISRSGSVVENDLYSHIVCDVRSTEYIQTLESILQNVDHLDLCVYCVGVGELLNLTSMKADVEVFDVNLMGLVKTVSVIIPDMVKNGNGHFIGLSSVADELLSSQAPSYHASKAGFSSYLESLAPACRPEGVYVTNVRFGFVDTKMAKGDVRPFMITTDKATEHLYKCIEKKPVRYTAPKAVVPLLKFRKWMMRLGLACW